MTADLRAGAGPATRLQAAVKALAADAVSHGHCFTSVPGLAGGSLIEIRSAAATIYCRVAWDFANRFDRPDQIALDRWQREALSCVDGAVVAVTAVDVTAVGLNPVDVAAVDGGTRGRTGLPTAEAVELRLLRGGDDLEEDDSPGLRDFLASGHYVLYPGLRFSYRPLAAGTAGEYAVVRVRAEGADADVAAVGERLRQSVHRSAALRAASPTYADLGGLDEVVALLRREIELPLRRPVDLGRIGVRATAGVLLCGAPGVGKTSLARAVAASCDAETVVLSGPALAGGPRPEAEEALRAALRPNPESGRPRLVILDDVDFLAPSRDGAGGTATGSFLGLLHALLDLPDRPVVIATTSRPDDVDPALRRLGRLGRRIPVPLPGDDERRAVLAVHTRGLALDVADETQRGALLDDLAARTSGFVGADLAALCDEAGRIALRRAFPLGRLESDHLQPLSPAQITEQDWSQALTFVTPSAIGGVVSEVPATTFADVAGLDSTIAELRERLVYPLRDAALFAEAGLRMERGVLLFGPPGTGKTLLARALANECGRRFLAVRGPELLNKWFGESERAVRDLFEKARQLAPSILFFDEVDAVLPRRTGGAADGGAADRVVNQLLAELDGLHDLGNVTVIGATNNPDNLDRAVLRPGRLGLHIEVPLPDAAGRGSLFGLYLPEPELADHLARYASQSEGMSGADIAMVAREARLSALRRGGFKRTVPLTDDDVLTGLARVRASLPIR